MAVPWILYPTADSGSLLSAVAPATLWAALWPVLIGGAIAVTLSRWGSRLPEGDIVVAGETVVRAAISWGDLYLRQWPMASLALLTLVIILGAMLAWG